MVLQLDLLPLVVMVAVSVAAVLRLAVRIEVEEEEEEKERAQEGGFVVAAEGVSQGGAQQGAEGGPHEVMGVIPGVWLAKGQVMLREVGAMGVLLAGWGEVRVRWVHWVGVGASQA